MDTDKIGASTTAVGPAQHGVLHYARRGEPVEDASSVDSDIIGFDAEKMKGRSLLTELEEKKLMRRVDWHLMTLCSIMFLLKNIDANNTANARIMNKGTKQNILIQLDMSSNAYNFITTIYYIPYIVFEAPSNLLIKRILPSRWQSRIMVTWGIALACHAAVHNKEGLYAARFFLGLVGFHLLNGQHRTKHTSQCEAGMFPGVILQMTYWYRPDEMSVRLLYFYALGNFSTVISGVLAFGFDTISGRCGLSGWQWIFLVEGVITIAFGIALWFILPDFPNQAKWLTEKEKAFIQARLPSNAPRAEELNFNLREIINSLKDKRMWLFTLVWATMTVGTTGLTFYQPTVIANLGFTTIAKSQLLNIPTAVLSIIIIAVSGFFADSAWLPRPVLPLTFLTGILACYSVLYTFPNNGGVYAATVISNALSSSWYPLMWPWRVQTTSRATGSAFAIGFVNSYGQIGGALGPQIFQSKYAPHYTVSFAIAMSVIGASILVTLFTWWVTRDTERQTREIKKARVAAAKRGESVLDDVDPNADLKHKEAAVFKE
ncbi:putative pantothenate transporter [Exophiala viscosa]|uniref:putative pantothenate transporter n=1 Tax=Exophiala viscosa TaxID=2486360 RepID=UPI00219AE0F9|nr:putative pantothenate transporter [Exophiala viscosa]